MTCPICITTEWLLRAFGWSGISTPKPPSAQLRERVKGLCVWLNS